MRVFLMTILIYKMIIVSLADQDMQSVAQTLEPNIKNCKIPSSLFYSVEKGSAITP